MTQPPPAAAAPATSLFPSQHVAPSWQLLLYAPLGCVVAPARAALWAALWTLNSKALTGARAALATASSTPHFSFPFYYSPPPPPFLSPDEDGPLLFLLSLLGVRVKWSHAGQLPPPGEFFVCVANHSSVADFLAWFSPELGGRGFTHLVHKDLPVSPREGMRVKVERATPSALVRLRKSAAGQHRRSASSPPPPLPVLVFPEGGLTASGAGLMTFSRGFASLVPSHPQSSDSQQNGGDSLLSSPSPAVFPVALRVRHAFDISTHTLDSSFVANLWWMCFAPWTNIDATVLPPMRRRRGGGGSGADEDDDAFAERVRRAICEALGVPATGVSLADKARLRGGRRTGDKKT